MKFTLILAHGGPLLGLMGLVYITAALVIVGLVIAFTSKTTSRRRLGVGLCLFGVVFFVVAAANFSTILRHLRLN